MLVPDGALVLLLDGVNVQLLRNRGSDVGPDLEAVRNDTLRQCGTRADRGDTPSRVREVVDALDPLFAGGMPLILVAPPDSLGALTSELPLAARRHVIAEIVKNLAHCPPHELAERLHRAAA
ncbi:host attachment protein [Sphingomonas spermidinifaciens]|nr:host attachment protein [Sphingomonas spermidinifaciens]